MRFLLLFLKFLWTWKERPDKGFSALSKVVLFMFLFFFQVIQLCPCQDSGVCLGIPTPLFFVKLHTEKIRSILDPKDIKQPRKCPFYQHFRGSVRYSNSQSSICFVVFPRYFRLGAVRFWTVLYAFSMFSSNCIVILLSVAYYTTPLKIPLQTIAFLFSIFPIIF